MPAAVPTETLVKVFRARDQLEGTLLVGFLEDNGIAATLRQRPAVPPVDYYEFFAFNDTIDGIFVFERDAARARELIAEFLTAPSDTPIIEQRAVQRPHPDREQIQCLRAALREQRLTFWFLSGLGVWFLVAGWLFVSIPFDSVRWPGLIGVAALIGVWLHQKP